MDRTEELILEYQQAQDQIIRTVEANPRGTEREYQERLTAKIVLILSGLYASTERWTRKNIPEMYDEDMESAHRNVSSQYRTAGKTPPNIGAETIADQMAKRNAERNMNIYLRDAIEATAQNMRTDIQRAAMQVAQDAVTKGQTARKLQEKLIAQLEQKGIASVSYVRNGQTCYMQLDTYAEMIARTTPHEIRNTVNINLGTRIGNDLVMVSEHWGACPICTPYQGRVFSTSGTNPNYPYLYSTPFSSTYQNFHPRCRHIITQYIESLHTPEENERMMEFSNRSYEIGGDGWTKSQTKAAENSLQNYREGQDRKRRIYNDRKQYERYKMVLGEDAPKTFSGFRKMKTANGERWKKLQAEYRKFNTAETLQEQLEFVYNNKKAFIPKDAIITNTKTIAGAGAKREIDIIDRLTAEYGGTVDEWTKKVGKIESAKYMFDVHWFEKNGTQYQPKIKYMKEKKS